MKRENVIEEKAFSFAVRIVRLCRYLKETKKEFVLSEQLLRSGTSVGANVTEAQESFSEKDFAAKLSIARKEVAESAYWIRLLSETDYLTNEQFSSIYDDAVEIRKILSSIVLTMEKKQKTK